MSDSPNARGAGGHRLFFALWPDDTVRGALESAVGGVAAFRGRGRRIAAAKYHLTLHFLGGWSGWLDAIAATARAAAAAVDARAFHLVVDRAGGFAGPRVGWLAPEGNSGLDALWSALGHALDDAAVPYRVHEHFSPHVTVMREMRGRPEESVIEPISWPVEDFVLVHSHAGRYDVIDRWMLPAG
ncbi:RNA 2',3'-cyclic phosphodiesterase [Lysobacter xanthus]